MSSASGQFETHIEPQPRTATDQGMRSHLLASLSLELMTTHGLAAIARLLTVRGAEFFAAHSCFMALAGGEQMRVAHIHGPAAVSSRALRGVLNKGLAEILPLYTDEIVTLRAAELLGPALAAEMQWQTVVIARLSAATGEGLGLLCLVDPDPSWSEDVSFLRSLLKHAAARLANVRQTIQVTQSSKQWAEIFDSITDLLLLHNDRFEIVRVNRALAHSRSKHPSELLGKAMHELFGDSPGPGFSRCPFCQAVQNGAVAREEFFDAATKRTYLVSSSKLVGISEKGRQTIHILRDVTEHREAERLYRELFDNLQEGAYFSTPDGRFLEVNDALVRMLGYSSQEELLHVDIPSQVYASPAQRRQLEETLSAVGTMKTAEVVLRRKDGSLLPVLETGFAVRNERGEISQFRGVILDISEIKRVQAQLKHEHDFNTQILNHTQSMILVVDTAGLVSYANRKCFETGVKGTKELVGNRLEEIVAPAHRRSLNNAFENTVEGHQISNLELALLRGAEPIGSFSANLSPMRDESGQVNSIVVVMTDITDMAMLQAKFVHAEKMAAVGQMVSGVAHEVNNPLTAILGFSDLLLQDPNLPAAAHEELKLIMHEAQRTKEIIQNLLSFARQNPVQRSKVQITGILRRTLALRAYDFANQGIEVEERFDDSIQEIDGDAHKLQQVFLNVLNNAYDALRDVKRRGRVVVETLRRGEVIEVRFSDNGPGISHIDRIFDPFFTTKEVGKGTGLGLSICYGIMREHKGEITCFNNPDGLGATFVVRLPISVQAQTTALEGTR
jgi:PAS domain S-box-containing protein